jgi:putative FmdB family regulatory protein
VPIYEFECQACGRPSEVMQKVSDPAPTTCPACGGGPLTRQVSLTSFQLKGGGWYADSYATPAAKAAPGPTTPAGSGQAPAASGAGKPSDGGKASDPGKPSEPGKSSVAGKPSEAGKPPDASGAGSGGSGSGGAT